MEVGNKYFENCFEAGSDILKISLKLEKNYLNIRKKKFDDCLEVETLRYRWMPTERGLRTLSFDQRCLRLSLSCILLVIFVFFFAFFVCFCTFFLHFWHVCIISFKFLNWKTLYFKVQLTKRPPAPFSRSNSEVDFCPFVSCFEGRIQYWSFETKYSVQYWGSPLCPLCQRMVEYLGT